MQSPLTIRQIVIIILFSAIFSLIGVNVSSRLFLWDFESRDAVLNNIEFDINSTWRSLEIANRVAEHRWSLEILDVVEGFESLKKKQNQYYEKVASQGHLEFIWNGATGSRAREYKSIENEFDVLRDSLGGIVEKNAEEYGSR